MNKLTDLFKRARGDTLVRHSVTDLQTQIDARITAVQSEMRILAAAIDQQTSILKQLVEDRSGVTVPTMGTTTAPVSGTTRAPVSLHTDVSAWRGKAQPGELAFHKRPNIRSGADWETDTDRKWRTFGFEQGDWSGKLVVDVGAGSRLRTRWFTGARIAAIEPLGDQFVEEVEWQDLDTADELYAVPAEQHIPELDDRADLVVSINALDHGFDFEGAVQNIRRYVKQDGLVFLSFDQHETPDEMHPLVLNEEITTAVFEAAGFKVEKYLEGGRYHGGPGLLALNFWLRPDTSLV